MTAGGLQRPDYSQAPLGGPLVGLPEGQLICWYPHGTVMDTRARLAAVGGSHWMSTEVTEPCRPGEVMAVVGAYGA